MDKFEYLNKEIDGGWFPNTEVLNTLGDAGWELINLKEPAYYGGKYKCLFKRKRQIEKP